MPSAFNLLPIKLTQITKTRNDNIRITLIVESDNNDESFHLGEVGTDVLFYETKINNWFSTLTYYEYSNTDTCTE